MFPNPFQVNSQQTSATLNEGVSVVEKKAKGGHSTLGKSANALSEKLIDVSAAIVKNRYIPKGKHGSSATKHMEAAEAHKAASEAYAAHHESLLSEKNSDPLKAAVAKFKGDHHAWFAKKHAALAKKFAPKGA